MKVIDKEEERIFLTTLCSLMPETHWEEYVKYRKKKLRCRTCGLLYHQHKDTENNPNYFHRMIDGVEVVLTDADEIE